uniref:hypothetical protein n=1 Tax=Stenotrophomonas maltophilia TaxID=40324 RepID=UPI0013D9B119
VYADARKDGTDPKSFDVVQRAEDAADRVKKNASLSIITHAPAESAFAQAVTAAAKQVGLGTIDGHITIGRHRQIVMTEALGHHVDGAFQ